MILSLLLHCPSYFLKVTSAAGVRDQQFPVKGVSSPLSAPDPVKVVHVPGPSSKLNPSQPSAKTHSRRQSFAVAAGVVTYVARGGTESSAATRHAPTDWLTPNGHAEKHVKSVVSSPAMLAPDPTWKVAQVFAASPH